MTIEPELRPATPVPQQKAAQGAAVAEPHAAEEAPAEPQQQPGVPEQPQLVESIFASEPVLVAADSKLEHGKASEGPERAATGDPPFPPEEAPAHPEPQPPTAELRAEPQLRGDAPDIRSAAPALPTERTRHKRRWLKFGSLVVSLGLLTLVASIVLFRYVNPPVTTVMAAEKLGGATLRRQWVPLGSISRSLPLAVIASEDGRFCQHWGVDWAAVRDAVNENRRGGFRGASTIPMQTAKNLYLWTERSYLRKLMEVPIAYLLTALWPKERVMEVYLNVAQWGPGIFGAEAASRYYFGKSASQLNRREALLLAAALPAPSIRNPAKPSARMVQIARAVERRMPVIAARSECLRRE